MEYFYIKKYLQMQSHIAEIIEKIEIFFSIWFDHKFY